MGSPRGRRLRGGPERSRRGAGGQVQKKRRGSPAAPDAPRQRAPFAALGHGGACPRGSPTRGAATNEGASRIVTNANDVVGLFAWPKKPRTVWAAAKAADHGPARSTAHLPRPAAERPATSTNINDDVDAYFKKWRRVVPHCAPLMQGSCVYVAPNGGIVHARDMSLAKNAGSSKQMLADLQLRAVSASLQSALPEDRWVSWNQVYTAAGPTKPRPWPTFAIGKREPHRPGLLMPNPFFGAPSWWARHNLLQIAASQKRSWATRCP